MAEIQDNLKRIRSEIDDIDDRIHDLLMRRADRVEAIAAEKDRRQMVIYRPAREAMIMRRLVARHQGALSVVALMRLWRELLPIMAGLQGDVSLAVLDMNDAAGAAFSTLARLHFGFLTPFLYCDTLHQVIGAVERKETSLGLLPYPDSKEGVEGWWVKLSPVQLSGLAIIVRLPFSAPISPATVLDNGLQDRSKGRRAFVLGPVTPEATGNDLTLIRLETSGSFTLEALEHGLLRSGHSAEIVAAYDKKDGGGQAFLLEFQGFYSQDLEALKESLNATLAGDFILHFLGAYAAPLPGVDAPHPHG